MSVESHNETNLRDALRRKMDPVEETELLLDNLNRLLIRNIESSKKGWPVYVELRDKIIEVVADTWDIDPSLLREAQKHVDIKMADRLAAQVREDFTKEVREAFYQSQSL